MLALSNLPCEPCPNKIGFEQISLNCKFFHCLKIATRCHREGIVENLPIKEMLGGQDLRNHPKKFPNVFGGTLYP